MSTLQSYRIPDTSRSLRPLVRAGIVLVTLLGLAACSPARLVHVDGEPFVERGPRLALEDGWIAIDSCASGPHALLELHLETADAFPLVPRWVHAQALGTLRDYRLEGPWCRTNYDGFYGEDYTDRSWMQKKIPSYGEQRCLYRVRAEYTLASSSTAPDSVLLAYFQNIVK